MSHVLSVLCPLPAFARAAAFAVLAMASVGALELWQHAAFSEPPPAAAAMTIDAAQPLTAAPSPLDMWRL